MTAKEYLQKIQKYRQIMEAYSDRIEELYNEASGLKAIVYDKDRVQVSPTNQMEEIFAQIDIEAQKYIRARLRYEKEVRKRIDQIAGLDNDLYARVLTLRYVDGKRWEEIACIIGYSFRHVIRVHGQALHAFQVYYKDVLLCHKQKC